MIDVSKYLLKNGKFYTKGTLAHYLDQRTLSVEEPLVSFLPSTINPLRFLLDNVFGNNAVILKIKQKAVTTPPEVLAMLHRIKELLPPEKIILLCFDMEEIVDSFNLSGISYEAQLGGGVSATESNTITFTESCIIGGLE